MSDIRTKLFADDTTLHNAANQLHQSISKLKLDLDKLNTWFEFNRLSINWAKIQAMVIINKRIEKQVKININDQIEIQVVKSFKLLDVHIDDRLNFQHHTKQVCSSINKKLYAIKRLSFLTFVVKMKFFKTFILPYFDFCISLSIYILPTNTINRIYNLYYMALYKLFKFDFTKK